MRRSSTPLPAIGYDGYRQALATRRLCRSRHELVVEAAFDAPSGHRGDGGACWSERQFDAVFVASDVVALGAIGALREAGRRVPDDVSARGLRRHPAGAPISTLPSRQSGCRRSSSDRPPGGRSSNGSADRSISDADACYRPSSSCAPRPRRPRIIVTRAGEAAGAGLAQPIGSDDRADGTGKGDRTWRSRDIPVATCQRTPGRSRARGGGLQQWRRQAQPRRKRPAGSASPATSGDAGTQRLGRGRIRAARTSAARSASSPRGPAPSRTRSWPWSRRSRKQTGIEIAYTGTATSQRRSRPASPAATRPTWPACPAPARWCHGAPGDLKPLDDGSRRGLPAASPPGFADLGSVDGKMVGIFTKATVKGLIWYNTDLHGRRARRLGRARGHRSCPPGSAVVRGLGVRR